MAETEQMKPPPEAEGGHERKKEWAKRVKERQQKKGSGDEQVGKS